MVLQAKADGTDPSVLVFPGPLGMLGFSTTTWSPYSRDGAMEAAVEYATCQALRLAHAWTTEACAQFHV